MKYYRRVLIIASLTLLLVSCSSAPVYRGSGVVCSGGGLSGHISSASGPRTSRDNRMLDEIESWMGTPYVYGGESRSGVDCSGFTQAVFRAMEVEIPRTASQQAAAADQVDSRSIRFGDLIFFNTSGGGISHVGIYIGDGFFAHASSSRGVVRESLAKRYYADRVVSIGRFSE